MADPADETEVAGSPSASDPTAPPAAGGQPPGDPYGGMVAGLQESEARSREILAQEESEMRPLVEGVKKTVATPLPKMPHEQPVPPAPQAPDKSGQAATDWLQATLVLSAIAGAFSRNSATVALNAFAGAINGFKAGQIEKFNEDYKAWKAASERTIANNKIVTDQYQAVLQNRKISLDEQMAQIQIVATQYKDRIMFEASASKSYTMVAQLLEKQREFEAKMQHDMDKIDRTHAGRMEEIEARARQRLDSPGGIEWYMGLDEEKRKEVDHVLQRKGNMRQLNDEEIKTIVAGMKAGKTPPTLTGLYGSNRGRIEAESQRQGFDLMGAQLEAYRAQREIAALNSNQMTQFVGRGRALVNTIELAREHANELKLGGVAPLNRAHLEWLVSYRGNTKEGQLARQYLSDVAAVKSELAQVESGGYAPHESAWDLAKQQVDASFGVDNLNAALDEVQRIVKYRINAIPGMATVGPGVPNRYLPGADQPPEPPARPPGARPPGATAPAGVPDWDNATVEVH